MIDREGRDRLALALRRYVVGRITSDDLENVETDWRDRGARAVHGMSYNLYSDDWGHYAVENHAIDPTTRREIVRWIVFLHSDQEYLWPEYRFDRVDWLSWFRPNEWLRLAGFRMRANSKISQLLEAGDGDVWPFLKKQDYIRALAAPRFLAGDSKALP